MSTATGERVSQEDQAQKGEVATIIKYLTTPRRWSASEDERALLDHAQRRDLPYRDHELAVWEWGSEGPRVLLVHGWDSRGSHLAGFAQALLAKGYRVVTFDAPGHGDSGGTTSNVIDLAKVIGEVAAAGPIDAVIGHSVGSPATLYALAHGLSVKASVHISGPSSLRRMLARVAKDTGLSASGHAALNEGMEAVTGIDLDDLEVFNLSRGFQHPALLVHDRDDNEVPHEESALLQAAWPLATLQTVSDLGHRKIIMDKAVIGACVEFLDSRLAPAGTA